MLAEALQSIPKRGGALSESRECAALQAVFCEINHHGDRLLHSRNAASCLVGGIRSKRKIKSIGRHETA